MKSSNLTLTLLNFPLKTLEIFGTCSILITADPGTANRAEQWICRTIRCFISIFPFLPQALLFHILLNSRISSLKLLIFQMLVQKLLAFCENTKCQPATNSVKPEWRDAANKKFWSVFIWRGTPLPPNILLCCSVRDYDQYEGYFISSCLKSKGTFFPLRLSFPWVWDFSCATGK